jgi:hypothetical protein
VTLTLTFRSLSIPESQFSKTWQHKAILLGKGYGGLSYSGTDEIPVSFGEVKNAGKSIWLDKATLKIIKPLKMVFCFSCDGVPLKFKKKNGRASSLPAQIFFSLFLTPLKIRWTILLSRALFRLNYKLWSTKMQLQVIVTDASSPLPPQTQFLHV